MLEAVLAGLGSLVVGGGLGYALRKYTNSYTIKKAKQEAADLIAEAKDAVEIKALEEKERTQEIELEMWSKVEPDMLKVEARIEELQEIVDEKKQKHDVALVEEKKKI